MNINSTNNINVQDKQAQNTTTSQAEASVKFVDELEGLKENKTTVDQVESKKEDNSECETRVPIVEEISNAVKKNFVSESVNSPISVEKNIDNLSFSNRNTTDTGRGSFDTQENVFLEQDRVLDGAIIGLSDIVNELNQSDEKTDLLVKKPDFIDDKEQEGEELINNDFNIQENKDILPQMSPNMNFSGGQPFSSFMNNEELQKQENKLVSSAEDLIEEAAILSTMAENVAIANKNQLLTKAQPVLSEQVVAKKEIVLNEQGNVVSKKTTTEMKQRSSTSESSIVFAENTVKFDTVVMKQADVEVFVNLVNNGEVNLNEVTQKNAQGAAQISKNLADLLAKSMENNQPVRIDFDNDISVIIRISRDGKISADFLPSTQIAEAYLKENLPLLKQRFEDNNIEYEDINHRSSKEREKDENKKKGRDNE